MPHREVLVDDASLAREVRFERLALLGDKKKERKKRAVDQSA
jgi:hypothetical protein